MKQHILFVDDKPEFLDGIQRLTRIRRTDWEVHTALNAEKAWERLDQGTIDVMVLDVTMPNNDGFGLLEQVKGKSQTRDIPVIILTGMREHALKRRALEQGATDLLNKPVVWEDLEARLQSSLCLKRYQDELKNQACTLEHHVRQRTRELETSRLEILLRLGKACEYRDEETGSHVLRMGFYCRLLAKELHLSEEFCETVFLTSPLHDIGKIGIADAILRKPGRFTPEEFDAMKDHCRIGYETLNGALERYPRADYLQMSAEIALSHHERFDGSGYPLGIKGQKIPLSARIVALADTYDALIRRRVYKEKFSHEVAKNLILEARGSQFDPVVVDVFLACEDEFLEITRHFQDEA